MSDLIVQIDGLKQLATDLTLVSPKIIAGAKAITAKGALNVKQGMQDDFSGIAHAPHFPRSITYTTRQSANGDVTAEIGPDKDKPQGALGNILAFGTSKNGPVADITAALQREEPNFVNFLTRLAEGSLG